MPPNCSTHCARAPRDGGEVLSFSDNEPLKALEAITTRQPNVIALERLFAATSRGAALINRIKADPALDGRRDSRRIGRRHLSRLAAPHAPPPARPAVHKPQPSPAPADAQIDVVEPAPEVDAQPAQNLDYRGTRRAPRFRMAEGTEVQVDGALATIVDLSTYGAQILCPTPLKPQQRVRMVLADDLGMVKFSASVAWAFFEIPKGVSRYRAGIEFKDAEREGRRCVLQTAHSTRPA